jgi:predicted  nucleic acid-binding Zn-ribbon protein
VRNLEDQISQLQHELDNSMKTFDVYRERAKVSLKKTALDQQKSDQKISELTEQLKVSAYIDSSIYFCLIKLTCL